MKEFCKVILRLISVYVFIKSFSFIQGVMLYIFSQNRINAPDHISPILHYAISFAGMISFAILIWVLSDRISSLIVTNNEPVPKFSTDGLLRTVIIVVGLILLVDTLPNLIGNIYEYTSALKFIENQIPSNGYDMFLHVKSTIITNSLKIVLSIIMIMGHRFIIKISKYFTVEHRDLVKDDRNEDV